MMLKLEIKRPAYNCLIELQAKQFKQVMLSIIRLTKDPYPNDSQKLAGYPYYRVDVGEFRVIYDIEDKETVRIILVGKRNDDEVYKRLRVQTQWQKETKLIQ
jgi:mRNA interferase RelE/StbE